MGGSSKETGTSTSTNYFPDQNYILGTAKSVMNNPAAWAPDTTSHVTPFSTQTMQGMNGMQNVAQTAKPAFDQNFNRINSVVGDGGLNNLQDQQVKAWQGIAGGSGLTPQQQSAMNLLRPTAAGTGLNAQQQGVFNSLRPTANGMSAEQQANYNAMNPTANGLNAMQQRASSFLDPIAAGKMMSGNPYLEAMIKKNSADIAGADNLMASGAGRYGSGLHADLLGRDVGDMATQLRYQNYGDEANRRDAAIQNLFGMGSTGNAQRANALGQRFDMASAGQNQRMNALGQQANLATTGQNQKTGAINDLFNMSGTGQDRVQNAISQLFGAGTQQRQNVLAGTGQLSDAYDARLQPYQTMMGIGSKYEDLNSRQLADQGRIFNARQTATQAPLDWISSLIGARGGTTTTTESQPNNPWQQGIGGVLGGLGLMGGLF